MERNLSELEHYQSGREQKKKENLHVVLWLVKDFAWLMHFKILGLVMAIPTVILAIVLTIKSLMSLFDTYYKWLFFQVRHQLKEGADGVSLGDAGFVGNSGVAGAGVNFSNASAAGRISTEGAVSVAGSDLANMNLAEVGLEHLDELDVSNYNFSEIFDFVESKGLLKNSKHLILKFLGYGDLGVENYARLRTTVLNDVLSDYYHNLAVACWIIGNVIWMVGEFFFDDTIRYVSVPFFVMGLLVVAWYYLYLKRKIKTKDPLEESSVKQ